MINPFKARKLRRAYKARDRADEALELATWRKDTQAKHKALRRLRDATHEALRLEVRRG